MRRCPHPSRRARSSTSASIRSPTAGTASRGSTASSSSSGAASPATPFMRGSRRSRGGTPRRSRSTSSRPGPSASRLRCAHFGACGGCRFQDLAYEAQLREKETQVRDALERLGGLSGRRARADRPGRRATTTATSSSTRSRRRDAGPALGFHRAGRWDEVLEIERCWLTTDVGNAIRSAVRDWARAEGLAAYDQRPARGTSGTSSSGRARNTGQALVVLVTAPGELRPVESARRRAAADPRGARDPLGGQRPPGRGDEPADARALGRGCDRGGDARPAASGCGRTRSSRRTRRCASACTAGRAEYAGLTGEETVYDLYCGIGDDRARRSPATRSPSGGSRSPRNPSPARSRTRELNGVDERGVLRRRGRAAQSRSSGRAPGAPTSSSSTRPSRADRQGAAEHRRARRAAHRLRLVQPDDPRGQRGGALRRARLPARARAARGHVPAHAAHRDGRRFVRADDGPLSAPPAEPDLRQSRSAFAATKPSESSGSAGRPPTSVNAVIASVTPKDERAQNPRQARPAGRSGSAAPRKSAKKSTSGRPSWAATGSPGTGKAMLRWSNSSGSSSMIAGSARARRRRCRRGRSAARRARPSARPRRSAGRTSLRRSRRRT